MARSACVHLAVRKYDQARLFIVCARSDRLRHHRKANAKTEVVGIYHRMYGLRPTSRRIEIMMAGQTLGPVGGGGPDWWGQSSHCDNNGWAVPDSKPIHPHNRRLIT